MGIDVAKEIHWAEIKVAGTGKVLASQPGGEHARGHRRADRARSALPRRSSGPATVGTDILGGIAALLEAMLLEAGLAVVHVPGLAVNRARRGTRGGEHKSDPKDARVIADQVRMRDDLRPVEADARRRRRAAAAGRPPAARSSPTRPGGPNRLRDLLASVHPGLERVTDVTTKTGLRLLTRYVTPAEIRAAGRRRAACLAAQDSGTSGPPHLDGAGQPRPWPPPRPSTSPCPARPSPPT